LITSLNASCSLYCTIFDHFSTSIPLNISQPTYTSIPVSKIQATPSYRAVFHHGRLRVKTLPAFDHRRDSGFLPSLRARTRPTPYILSSTYIYVLLLPTPHFYLRTYFNNFYLRLQQLRTTTTTLPLNYLQLQYTDATSNAGFFEVSHQTGIPPVRRHPSQVGYHFFFLFLFISENGWGWGRRTDMHQYYFYLQARRRTGVGSKSLSGAGETGSWKATHCANRGMTNHCHSNG